MDHQPDGTYYLGDGSVAGYSVVNGGLRYRLTRSMQLVMQASDAASPKLNDGCVETLTTLSRVPGPGVKNNSFPSGDHADVTP